MRYISTRSSNDHRITLIALAVVLALMTVTAIRLLVNGFHSVVIVSKSKDWKQQYKYRHLQLRMMMNCSKTNSDTFDSKSAATTARIALPTNNNINKINNDSTTNNKESMCNSKALPFQQEQKQEVKKKYHHITVCIVPPESHQHVWDTITSYRKQYNDPGFFRWPPHINLLYPFIDARQIYNTTTRTEIDDSNVDRVSNNNSMNASSTIDTTVLSKLRRACQEIEPFSIKLQQFGTFGNSQRGVLWIYPDSYCHLNDNDNNSDIVENSNNTFTDNTSSVEVVSPLMQLQELLVKEFPYCNDLNLKSDTGFNPHMTISHFINHHDAIMAQQQLQQQQQDKIAEPLSFVVEYIYLLERNGDNGQFVRIADIPLGKQNINTTYDNSNNVIIVHDPIPKPFRSMPTIEDEWVYNERMKLKQRRNGSKKQKRR